MIKISNIDSFVFVVFIQYVSAAKKSRYIMQGVIFYQLVTCVVFIAFSLFGFDQTVRSFNLNTSVCLLSLISAVTPTFIYCYYAESVTVDLLKIGDIFYESTWYELTYQEQKLLIPPIQRAQRVFRMNGYGLIDCSLGIFASVCFRFLLSSNSHFKIIINFFHIMVLTDNPNIFIILSYNTEA